MARRIPGEFIPLDVHFQRQLRACGVSAELLFIRALAAVRLHKTDGAVTQYDLNEVGTGIRRPREAAGVLVRENLWIVMDDGWRIRSWEKWNGTKDEVSDERAAQQAAQRLTNHKRFHLAMDKIEPKCEHCQAVASDVGTDTASGSQKEKEKEKESKNSSSPIADAMGDPPREDVELLCKTLHERVTSNGSKATITKTWRDAARKLLDLDSRPLEQALSLIEWCQDDEFWRANVMSMPKFRSKYDQLRLKSAAVQGAVAMADLDEWLRQMFRDGTVKPIEARSGLRLPDEYQPEDDTSTAKEWQIHRRREWIAAHHDEIVAAIKEREK